MRRTRVGVSTLVVFAATATLMVGPTANGETRHSEAVFKRAVGIGLASPGEELWVAHSPAGDHPTALEVSPDGLHVFVTGNGFRVGSRSDFVTGAVDGATGARLWGRHYDGPVSRSDDGATALGVSPDGSVVFATGYSGASFDSDYATLAYATTTGETLWRRRYNVAISGDRATALGVSPNGSAVFVTGYRYDPATLTDYATLAYDAVTGETLWGRRYNSPANGHDDATALGVSPNGSVVFVTGSSYRSAGTTDFVTVAYDALTGATLWSRRHNGEGNGGDSPRALAVSPDGSRVFVAGYSEGSDNYEFATVAYDAATGATIWGRQHSGAALFDESATAIEVSGDGSSVFVTGYSYRASSDYDYATFAYDASTGASLWGRRYNGSRNDYDRATAIGVSPDSSAVFVTGSSSGSARASDFATLAYDASSGTRLWARRYNGPANDSDEATALAVSLDGSIVFVTGESARSGGGYKYATIAYSSD